MDALTALDLVLSAIAMTLTTISVVLNIRTLRRDSALRRALAEAEAQLAFRAEIDRVARLIEIGRESLRH